MTMKKTLFIAISLLCEFSVSSSAETVILNVTNDATTSYTASNIISLGDKEGSTPDSLKSATFTLNGASVTATFETGYGSARAYLSSSDAWSHGLPSDISSSLSLTEADCNALLGSGVSTTGNSATYPGKITLTLSGLSAGTYDLSGLSAMINGNTATTSWHLTLNSSTVTDATVASYSYDAATGAWSDSGTETTFSGTSSGTASAQYVSFNNINVTSDNSTLVLQIDGNITPGNQKGFQFATISATAAPEPATAALGLLALGVFSLRRRRS